MVILWLKIVRVLGTASFHTTILGLVPVTMVLHQMILINQKNIGTFLCNIQHTLRKATFTKYAIDNLIPRKSLANFCSIIYFFF